MEFKLNAPFQPTGDQPQAIQKLTQGVLDKVEHQVLLGVTGSGKSVGYEDLVLVAEENDSSSVTKVTAIGPLIDTHLTKHPERVVLQGDTEVINVSELDSTFHTLAYNSKSGETGLFPIQSFTRHRAPEKMYRLETECGRSISLTGDHNLWVLREGQVTLIRTDQALTSDCLPIPRSIPEMSTVGTIDVFSILRSGPFYVESESFAAYMAKVGPAATKELFSKLGVKSPYSKMASIRNKTKGSGIPISLFLDLLALTNNLDTTWNPKSTKIYSRSRRHPIAGEIRLDSFFLRFLGYYLAEGCSTDNYCVIANDNPSVRSEIEAFLESVQVAYAIRKSSDYQLSSKVWKTFLSNLCGANAWEKQLPSFWPNLGLNELGQLLSAYFDGDGTVSRNNEVSVTTASQKLASELLYALSFLGISARKQKKWKRATNTNHKGDWYYQVSISGKSNLIAFQTRIGFSVDHKADRLKAKLNRIENTNTDVVPGIGKILRALREKLGVHQKDITLGLQSRTSLSLVESGLRAPSQHNLLLLLRSLELVAKKRTHTDITWWNQWQELMALTTVRWTPIKSVELLSYSSKYVYDFSVPGPETFLAGGGGLFVHNTYTMANVIQNTQKPTLILAHNKTLAAQLYQEFRDFFPENAVSYFVSYYDYYQPEAYIASSDTYIEKEATINDEIDKLRLASTANLLTRKDVIVVASVSCIYNLGSPVEYGRYTLTIVEGEVISRETLLLQLSNLQYVRSEADLKRGSYRLRGDSLQIWPAYEDTALRIDTLENKIISINRIDPVTGTAITEETPTLIDMETGLATKEKPRSKKFTIYPAKHYVVNPKSQDEGIKEIESDLMIRVNELQKSGRVIEAYRLEQRVKYDLEMIREFGFVNGIENYSRHFDGRKPGDPPFTLLDYFNFNAKEFGDGSFLTLIDESHISLPQIRGMYNGDQARKQTLVEYGFRLPSALDNRPLQFHEFLDRTTQMIYVSATPQEWELSHAGDHVVEQLIRPTGLLDPEVELRRTDGQIEDLIIEILKRKQLGQRTLVTTLTKKMAEALTEYLNDEEKIIKLVTHFKHQSELESEQVNPERIIRANEQLPIDTMPIGPIEDQYYSIAKLGTAERVLSDSSLLPKVAYLHSDIITLERSDILDDLRRGVYDVVVGINLLREGLDLPEVTLVAILDADKEGFLRSRSSLIQTMGRAARHTQGRAILYADKMTKSMIAAIEETNRRRTTQLEYNATHGINPETINKPFRERMLEKKEEEEKDISKRSASGVIVQLNKRDAIDLDSIKPDEMTPYDKKTLAPKLRRRMNQAANDMDFELAAMIRDIVKDLE